MALVVSMGNKRVFDSSALVVSVNGFECEAHKQTHSIPN